MHLEILKPWNENKMNPILFAFTDNQTMVKKISSALNLELGSMTIHTFPDRETYIKINSEIKNKEVILLCSLNEPNTKILPLLLFSENAHDLGAKNIGLIAPYLAYMRQDTRFQPGEAISSKYFASLLSSYFDWLITIDPHLHRYKSLTDIYTIPTTSLHAMDLISKWLSENIDNPLLIGPDSESEQWLKIIADKIQAPYLILKKIRINDEKVEIQLTDVTSFKQRIPILIDDIISSGETMIETIKLLKQAQLAPPICIAIHAIFSNNSYQNILAAGVKKIITCNTVSHPSNQIDISELLVSAIQTQAHKLP